VFCKQHFLARGKKGGGVSWSSKKFGEGKDRSLTRLDWFKGGSKRNGEMSLHWKKNQLGEGVEDLAL